jgi:hypothetical protein
VPAAKPKAPLNPFKVLRARLSAAGVKRAFLNKVVLPDWWDDSIALTTGGFREGAGHICAHLGYSLASLLDEKQPLAFAHQAGVKYKKAKNVTAEEVGLATHFSLGVARAVATAFTGRPAAAPLPAPAESRQALLAAPDQPWVKLPQLLGLAWSAGIPVIHLRKVPTGAKKPDALTTMIGNRPVIVVLNGRKSPSWIAFIIAHELGHIQRGHLKPGHTVVDEKIDAQADDADEKEANDYASRLLTGHDNLGLHSSRLLDIARLADEVTIFGRDYRVAPGVAALNYGFTTARWAVANGAVALLEREEDAALHLKQAMKKHLKPEALSEEAWGWISRATATE